VDGGQFKGGVVVEVHRIGLFSFKVILTEAERDELKALAELQNMSYEELIASMLRDGLDYLTDG